MKIAFTIWVGILFSFFTLQATAAKDQFDIADWLDRNTAALVTINDVATTYERIKQLSIAKHPSWNKVRKLLERTDQPIIHAERMELIIGAALEIDFLITQIRQFDLVIHDLDQMTWTISVEAAPGILDDLQLQLASIVECMLNAGEPVEEELRLELETLNQASQAQGWGSWVRTEERLFISNDQSMRNIIQNEGETAPEKPLTSDRAFQTIRSRATRLGDLEGQISIYLKPIRVGRLFPAYSAQEWKGYGTDEFPAAGLNFAFQPESLNPKDPMVLADATIMFTQPRTKRPLMYSYYEKVKIPFLAVKPVELFAFNRDEEKFYRESCRCYDEMFGEGAADRYFQNRFANDDRDFYNDAAPRRNSYLDIRFFKSLSDSNLHLMRLENVKNREAMNRYLLGMINEFTTVHRHPVEKMHDDDFQVWRLNDDRAQENVGKLEPYSYYLQSDNSTMDSYLLGDEWYVEGEWPETQIQLMNIQGLAETESKDHGQPIRELIDDLLNRMDDSEPFMIKYYEPDSWTRTIQKYAMPTTLSFEVQIRRIEGQNNEFELVQDEEASKKQRYEIELKKTIYRALASSFGRQLYLYTQDDNEIRILFGCYPELEDEDSN